MNDPENETKPVPIKLGNSKFNFSAKVVKRELPYRLKDNPRVTISNHGKTIIVDEVGEMGKELIEEICNKSRKK